VIDSSKVEWFIVAILFADVRKENIEAVPEIVKN
jgi:hypothetical protein